MYKNTGCLRIILEYRVGLWHDILLSGLQGVSMLGKHTENSTGNRCYVEMDNLYLLHLDVVNSHRCLTSSYYVVSAIRN